MPEKKGADRPLLSICIPTYNRCEYLIKSVESIICQKEFLNGSVEIIISDNASDDGTEQYGKKLAEEYPNVSYFRNEININDCNFPLALSRAKGALGRLSNDTLIYKRDALAYMCDIIEANMNETPFIFWGNGEGRNPQNNSATLNFREFVISISYWITSLPGISLWTDQSINIENDIDGTDLKLWQVRKALKEAFESNHILFDNRVLFQTQRVTRKKVDYGLFQVFFVNYFKLLDPYFSNGELTESDREDLEKDLLYRFFTGWCIDWDLHGSQMIYSKEESLKEAIWNHYNNKPYWKHYLRYYQRNKFKAYCKHLVKEILNRK